MSVRSETRIPIRIFNALASISGAGAAVKLHPDALLECAAKKYGDGDFGDDQFLEGFRALCRSLETDADLHASGRIYAKSMILNALHRRLELRRRWQAHPEVLKSPVEKPIFIQFDEHDLVQLGQKRDRRVCYGRSFEKFTVHR